MKSQNHITLIEKGQKPCNKDMFLKKRMLSVKSHQNNDDLYSRTFEVEK